MGVGQDLFGFFNQRYFRRARKRAYRLDDEYRRIEDLVEANSGPGFKAFVNEEAGLTIETWEYQHEVARKLTKRMPHLVVLQFLTHKNLWPTDLWRRAKWYRQRGRRGYSDLDTWNFFSYMTKVIIGGVQELRDNLHGWPGEPLHYEDWEEILDKIVLGFKAAQKIDQDYPKGEELEALQAQFDEGFELLHKWFFHLWD